MARVTGLEPATSGVTGRHSNQLSYTRAYFLRLAAPPAKAEGRSEEEIVARVTGLEPATSGVTGRHSNQLSYTRTYLETKHSFQRLPFIRRPQPIG